MLEYIINISRLDGSMNAMTKAFENMACVASDTETSSPYGSSAIMAVPAASNNEIFLDDIY